MTVAVIGGGVSGLAVGHALQGRGHEVVVLEAQERAGGVIRTLDRKGFLLETAANGFLDKEPAMRRLVETLGLVERLRPATPSAKLRFIYTRGKLRALPASPPAFLGSDILPLSSRLRVMLEPLCRRGRSADESVAQFARRHMGKRATAVLIDAAQTGIFAGDVERLSAPAAFPKMVQWERQHRSLVMAMVKERPKASVLTTFDRGMQTLTDALAAALGPRLRLGTPVEALRREKEGFVLQLQDGELRAEKVVIAAPVQVAARLLAPLAPEVAAEVAAIRCASLTTVHLGFSSPPKRPLGFGFLVPSEEGRKVLGTLYVSSFFPHRVPEGAALYTVMVGGAMRPELAALEPAALVQLVREELEAIAQVQGEPDLVEVVRWQEAVPQYEVGHLARLKRVDEALASIPGLQLLGNGYRGVGVNDCVREAEAVAAATFPTPGR